MLFFLFFFQAEDGIRDTSVTGVQTCALPISLRRREPGPGRHRRLAPRVGGVGGRDAVAASLCGSARQRRSEERRVGKECRSRWWAEDEKKKGNRERERDGIASKK